jgi:hypothetical protein
MDSVIDRIADVLIGQAGEIQAHPVASNTLGGAEIECIVFITENPIASRLMQRNPLFVPAGLHRIPSVRPHTKVKQCKMDANGSPCGTGFAMVLIYYELIER